MDLRLPANLQIGMAPDGKAVVVVASAGPLVVPLGLTAEEAEEAALRLTELARQVRTGLLIPKNGKHLKLS